MTVKEVLVRAMDRIANHGWCRTELAVDKFGNPVDVEDPMATAFCSIGSILRESKTFELRWEALKQLERVVGRYIGKWNDGPRRTKDEVIQAFDKAIQLAGQQGWKAQYE